MSLTCVGDVINFYFSINYSGNCGVYAVRFMQHLVADLPLLDIREDKVQYYRDKFCLDILYENDGPEI